MSKTDFTSDEFYSRRERVRRLMADREIDWLIAIHPASIHWLTGSVAKSFSSFQCLIVFADSDRVAVLTRKSEEAEFRSDAIVEELYTWGGAMPEEPASVFASLVKKYGLAMKRGGLEAPSFYLSPEHGSMMRSILGASVSIDRCDIIASLKLVKSEAELAYVRKAARIADVAIDACMLNARPGASETTIAAEIYRTILSEGGGQPATALNLVTGPRCCLSHGAPTERILETTDIGHVEFGVPYRSYPATIGRQFYVGALSQRVKYIYSVVSDAFEACIGEIRDGVPANIPHEAARRVFMRARLDQYRVHATGYSIGPGFPPAFAEPVRLFSDCSARLRAGMVLSVCPNLFLYEEGLGARVVDNVIVQPRGAEVLSCRPRDLIALGS